MNPVVNALLCVLAGLILLEAWPSIKCAVKGPLSKTYRWVKKLFETKREVEKQKIVLKKLWLDITPAPMKVIVFTEGKVDCQLVMHGPCDGVVKRLLLLWKDGKCRSKRLDALCGIKIENIDLVYSTSWGEAMKIAQAMYGKKKHAKAASIEEAMPQPKAAAPPIPVVVEQKVAVTAAPVVPMPSAAPVERAAPILKGCVAQYVGEVVSSGVSRHPTGGYDIFTLTINTERGPEHIAGVDVKRALVSADAKEGDKVRVIHVRTDDLPGGKHKKIFQIINLSNRSY